MTMNEFKRTPSTLLITIITPILCPYQAKNVALIALKLIVTYEFKG